MWVLFLDPLMLTLLLGLLVYCWVVWRGGFRAWLGTGGWWTVVAWPLPLLVVLGPAVAGGSLALVRLAGSDVGDGGVLGAVLYALLYTVPIVAAIVLPPRWLLPGWARRRLVALPARGDVPQSGAVGALSTSAGHGSRARWGWRVDAVAGYVWIHGQQLRFRALGESTPGDDAGRVPEFDPDALADLRLNADGELRLEPPRGGLFSRRYLDVDLTDIDAWRIAATRRWRRDGLIVVEVDGRAPVHLWVADVDTVAGGIRGALAEA